MFSSIALTYRNQNHVSTLCFCYFSIVCMCITKCIWPLGHFMLTCKARSHTHYTYHILHNVSILRSATICIIKHVYWVCDRVVHSSMKCPRGQIYIFLHMQTVKKQQKREVLMWIQLPQINEMDEGTFLLCIRLVCLRSQRSCVMIGCCVHHLSNHEFQGSREGKNILIIYSCTIAVHKRVCCYITTHSMAFLVCEIQRLYPSMNSWRP